MKRLFLPFALLALSGCAAPVSPPRATSEPTPHVTATVEPGYATPSARFIPSQVNEARAFLGPVPIGRAIQTRSGAGFVEARRFAQVLQQFAVSPERYPAVWDFQARTVAIERHVFKPTLLDGRTGFIPCAVAAKTFDLALEHEGDLWRFEPISTVGGTENADHVYRDPKTLWESDDGRMGPKE